MGVNAWAKRKLRGWLDGEKPTAKPKSGSARTVYGDGKTVPTLTEKQAQHFQSNDVLRLAMLGMGPGWWASDHAEEAQHFTGANYCAVHAKCKLAAQATARLYKRTPKKDDNSVRAKEASPDTEEYERNALPASNALVRFLEKPNPRWSGAMFRYQTLQQLDLTGTALVWKVRDVGGKMREWWIIPTALARPYMPSPQFPEGAYWVTATGLFTLTGGAVPIPTVGVGAAAGVYIDARDIHPIRWPHAILMADGQSPLNAGSVQVDLAEEVDQAAWAVMHNSVDPSVVLSLDPSMQIDETELDRVEAKINERRAGVNNKGRVFIIQGAKPENLHRSPQELDYASSRPQCWNNVLAIQGMSPPACGIPSDTGTYSAYYVQLQQSIELTVQPELSLVASELTRLFHAETGDESLECEILAKSFNDPDVIDKKLHRYIAAGNAVTVKEYRAAEGLPPFGDERDEEFVGQRTTIRAGTEDDTDPSLPGVQFGDRDTQDDSPDDSETGVRKKPAASVREKLNALLMNGVN